ncbi:hypothetical protein QTO34_016684 [Cnephaeus nilssonii]|uniref:Uncharacterized protein n=1 Tax=Cnephaeus nilssonii TaxID=3371016 RepID=A0AA40I2P6_CNENI|nr:hypothetical protein QTO34_016684 [Eptesicus nilssonii]
MLIPDPGAHGLSQTQGRVASPDPGAQASENPDPGAHGLTRTRAWLTRIQGPTASPGPGTQAHPDPGAHGLTRTRARLTRIQGPTASPGPGARLTRIQGPTASPGPGTQAHPDPGAHGLTRTRGQAHPDPGAHGLTRTRARLTRIQGPTASPGPGTQAHPDPGPTASPGPGTQAHPDPGAHGLTRTRGQAHPDPGAHGLTQTRVNKEWDGMDEKEKERSGKDQRKKGGEGKELMELDGKVKVTLKGHGEQSLALQRDFAQFTGCRPAPSDFAVFRHSSHLEVGICRPAPPPPPPPPRQFGFCCVGFAVPFDEDPQPLQLSPEKASVACTPKPTPQSGLASRGLVFSIRKLSYLTLARSPVVGKLRLASHMRLFGPLRQPHGLKCMQHLLQARGNRLHYAAGASDAGLMAQQLWVLALLLGLERTITDDGTPTTKLSIRYDSEEHQLTQHQIQVLSNQRTHSPYLNAAHHADRTRGGLVSKCLSESGSGRSAAIVPEQVKSVIPCGGSHPSRLQLPVALRVHSPSRKPPEAKVEQEQWSPKRNEQ